MLMADLPCSSNIGCSGLHPRHCGSSNARACQIRKSGHVLHARQGYLAETSLGQAFDSDRAAEASEADCGCVAEISEGQFHRSGFLMMPRESSRGVQTRAKASLISAAPMASRTARYRDCRQKRAKR